MNSLTIGFISAGCIFGGVLLGLLLQKVLAPHHLESDSKDTVKLGAGMLATLTALVLGLLVSSAKGSFDAMNAGIAQTGAKILLVDHILADYGPETKEVREQLRHIVASVIEKIWPEKKGASGGLRAMESVDAAKTLQVKLRELTPNPGTLSHLYSSCLLRLMRASCAKRINAKPRKHVAMMKSNPAP